MCIVIRRCPPPRRILATPRRRAAPRRPVAILLGVGAGAVALGAFTAQLGCMDVSFRHLLVSHGMAPLFGGLLLLGPLVVAFRRLRG